MNTFRIRFMIGLLCAVVLGSWSGPALPMIVIMEEDEAPGEGAGSVLARPGSETNRFGVPTLANLGSVAAGSVVASGGPANNVAASNFTADQDYPAAISDGAGGMILVWEDFRDAAVTGADIYAHHLLACGTLDPAWPTTGVVLTQAPGNDRFPVVSSDGAGGAYVVWVGVALSAPGDIFAQHLVADGTLDPGWPANGIGVCTAPGRQIAARITADSNGGAFVTWDDSRPGRRVFVQHLVPGGVDPAWTPDGILACPGSVVGQQVFPVMCADGAGGAIVAWVDTRNFATSNRDIYAQRMDATGTLLWAPAGMPVCRAPGLQVLNGFGFGTGSVYNLTSSDDQSNAIVPDGAGGCLLTWVDERTLATTGDDVYAQRLTATGAVVSGWPVNGVALCTAPDAQRAPSLVPDGSGGAIGMWLDSRPAPFAQHVSGAGSVTGPPNGLALSAAGPAGFRPQAVIDGSGGAILVWHDARNFPTTDVDAFAHHVLTTPGIALDPAWPVDGAPVSTATGAQFFNGGGSVVSNGAGGAVAAWEDLRDFATTNIDIYAQEVLASGNLPTAPGATITGPATGSVFPVNTIVTFSGSFTDTEPDLHTAQWEFDGLPAVAGTVNEAANTVSATYAFTTPGVFLVKLTVTDACGNASSASQVDGLDAMVVVYDPSAGFITGGGWINSPAGAYTADPTLVGRANLGFVAKYLRGATVPTGNTEFQFRSADMNFSSTSYDWLVVAGARAQYKGQGTINDGGDYAFMLTAIDGNLIGGQPDRLRMKITDRSNNALVYDNQLAAPDDSDPTTVLGGGSIMLHKPNGMRATDGVEAPAGEVAEIPIDFALSPGEPNPFRIGTTIGFALPERSHVEIDLLDVSGRRVRSIVSDEREAGRYTIRLSGASRVEPQLASGIYFLRMNATALAAGTRFASTRKLVLLP